MKLTPRPRFLTCLIAAGLTLLPAGFASATCWGTRYDYYDTPSLTTIVGTRISCPGLPDQWDENPDGTTTQTPWFTTEPVVCPCTGGGGGGNGDENDEDGAGP